MYVIIHVIIHDFDLYPMLIEKYRSTVYHVGTYGCTNYIGYNIGDNMIYCDFCSLTNNYNNMVGIRIMLYTVNYNILYRSFLHNIIYNMIFCGAIKCKRDASVFVLWAAR